ncbi:MAG: MOSC N-terminal beta barrel domain-containing protein [Acidimicrobiales bacterium]
MAELTIAQIWRYPVKSLGGERLDEVEITDTGLHGDRGWGLLHVASGKILTARRRPELLFASAKLVDGRPEIILPDGSVAGDDAALSAWLGEPIELRRAGADTSGTFESPTDAEHEDAAPWVSWSGPTGSFHDSTKSRVSMVSTTSLGEWDIRRFRTNLVLDGSGEDDLVGSNVRIGSSATLVMNKPIDRCVMITRPQPGLERDLDVLRTINAERGSNLSVGGNVLASGTIRLGDAVTAQPA